MKDADTQIIALLNQIKALSGGGGGGGVAWGAITGTLSAQGDLQAALDAKPGYKVYTALLTQAGVGAPVATILQNTLSEVPTFGYNNPGDYNCTSSGIFLANKTTVTVGSISNPGKVAIAIAVRLSDSVINIISQWDAGSTSDDALLGTFFEIRVYP